MLWTRDISTYVLNTDLKIYLTASSSKEQEEVSLGKEDRCISEIEKDIIERDKRDMNRDFAPLRQAEDAILIDSSDMTIEEVNETIIKHVPDTIKNL